MYWTFTEFCQHLQNDLAWFTFTCLRTDELKEATSVKHDNACSRELVHLLPNPAGLFASSQGIMLLRPHKEGHVLLQVDAWCP